MPFWCQVLPVMMAGLVKYLYLKRSTAEEQTQTVVNTQLLLSEVRRDLLHPIFLLDMERTASLAVSTLHAVAGMERQLLIMPPCQLVPGES